VSPIFFSDWKSLECTLIFTSVFPELQAMILEELLAILEESKITTLKQTSHIRFFKSVARPKKLVINDYEQLPAFFKDVSNFERIFCRHDQSPRPSHRQYPNRHILFGGLNTLTIPIPSSKDLITRKLCREALEHMVITNLTLLIKLDEVTFLHTLGTWSKKFVLSVKDLTLEFSGDHLDKAEVFYRHFISGQKTQYFYYYHSMKHGTNLYFHKLLGIQTFGFQAYPHFRIWSP